MDRRQKQWMQPNDVVRDVIAGVPSVLTGRVWETNPDTLGVPAFIEPMGLSFGSNWNEPWH